VKIGHSINKARSTVCICTPKKEKDECNERALSNVCEKRKAVLSACSVDATNSTCGKFAIKKIASAIYIKKFNKYPSVKKNIHL